MKAKTITSIIALIKVYKMYIDFGIHFSSTYISASEGFALVKGIHLQCICTVYIYKRHSLCMISVFPYKLLIQIHILQP